jgi:hypothetical protein
MKFYAAETCGPITLELVNHDTTAEPVTREFPAGTVVSATRGDIMADTWHLNVRPNPADEWECWSGYTQGSNLVIGDVIATVNEG